MQENCDGIIRIEQFDSDTVNRMLDAVYTGDYSGAMPDKQETRPSGAKESSKSTFDDGLQIAIIHSNVAMIADYYNMQLLKELANKKLAAHWLSNWNVDSFIEFLKQLNALGGVEIIIPGIQKAAVRHMDELARDLRFTKLNLPACFLMAVLVDCMQNGGQAVSWPRSVNNIGSYRKNGYYCDGNCGLTTGSLIVTGDVNGQFKLALRCGNCDRIQTPF
ncbi:hypothetical protein AAP_05532 [Ascosphaera apis ARSEF 7405]|uniref:BTB/POZ fold protein n=1 Tax=Ascosphaera apis ARSEF 7405 TaxID=392613 RepID=A0A167VJK3_9EURO|nr:hypothetical protein AAP_05532 [Ascosphaera apis ARSEF 7405]